MHAKISLFDDDRKMTEAPFRVFAVVGAASASTRPRYAAAPLGST